MKVTKDAEKRDISERDVPSSPDEGLQSANVFQENLNIIVDPKTMIYSTTGHA